MKDVSEAYKEYAMDTTQPRAAKAMIEFCITEEPGEYSEECSPYYGFVDQIMDEVNERTSWATCEPGRFALDGSFCIPNYTEQFKYGYISQAMSDAAGAINVKLKITFVGTKETNGITICFQEPVHNFSITIGSTIYTVENNDELQYYVQHTEAYNQLELSITKIEPNRRVRISQIFLGSVITYDDEKIVDLSLIGECSLDNTKLPSDSADFSIINEAKEFDMLNESGLYKYLKQNQPVNTYLGIRTGGRYEYAQMGRFYIDSWSTKNMVASFTAYSAVYAMDEDEYRFGRIEYRTLFSMLEELLNDVGVKHVIDESLGRLTVSGYISTVKKREAMRIMLQTGCCMAISDNKGRIIITKRGQTPQEANKYEVIDGNNLLGWPEMKQKKNYSEAEVTINTFAADEEIGTIFEGTVKTINGKLMADGRFKVWAAYKESPAKDVEVSGVQQYEAYACGAYVYITEDTDIVITGRKVTVSQSTYIKKKYAYDNPIKISNNLIITEANAEDIADYALTELDLTATASYTGFPYMDPGDSTQWETEYGDKTLFLTKHTMEYNGALSGKMEGAGRVGG